MGKVLHSRCHARGEVNTRKAVDRRERDYAECQASNPGDDSLAGALVGSMFWFLGYVEETQTTGGLTWTTTSTSNSSVRAARPLPTASSTFAPHALRNASTRRSARA